MEKKVKKEYISAFEPVTLVVSIALSILSAIICMQLIGKIGTTPNTSLIGAIMAMLISRVPFKFLKRFKSLERQNLVQTTVSAGGFAAANCALLTVSIFWVMGETQFIVPMLIGNVFAVSISILIVGKLFDSKIYPADEAWPPGVATASAIEAGDEGGEKGKRLIQGLIVGAIATFFKLPAAAVGTAFISNKFAISALGIGLIIRGYAPQFLGIDLGTTYIPHGIMIGAGFVALIQSVKIIMSGNNKKSKSGETVARVEPTVSDKSVKRTILISFGVHLVGALLVAVVSGIITDMSMGMFIPWLLWASFSSVVSMLLVGMSAMHSGWFPAFAITTIFMTLGVFFGFPAIPLALLTGYVSAVGPCFADMGYDLKTGWILRGRGVDREYELYGRKQQVYIEMIGGMVGIAVAALSMNLFFEQDLLPPVSRVFATTVSAGVDGDFLKTLLIWAIPGGIIQFIGGTNMVGILFGTGLLITNPVYGIGIIGAVIVRVIIGDEFMDMRSAGLIVGDGLYGFFSSIVKALF